MILKLFLKSKKVFLLILILFFIVMSIFLPKKAFAGNGYIYSQEPIRLNLTVLFDYDASWEDIDTWREAFQEASRLLYNSTEEQMQIGTIDVYINEPSVLRFTDVLILKDESGRASAHINGMGSEGHVTLHQEDKFVYGGATVIQDSYGQIWIPNTPSGYGSYYTSVSQFPAFDDLVGKKRKLFSGTEVIGFDTDTVDYHIAHWRYGDTGIWCKKPGSSYNLFNTRTKMFYNDHWNYVYCPNMGSSYNYEYGFIDTYDIAVVAMAINDIFELYVAKKTWSGDTEYHRFYVTEPEETPMIVSTIDDNYKGQVVIVHELGHYAFGLGDEYKGVNILDIEGDDITMNEEIQCTGDPTSPACLMDAAGAIIDENFRTEWCTPTGSGRITDHNNETCVIGENTYLNYQEAYNHKSCWESIIEVCESYSVTLNLPEGELNTELTSEPEDIEWNIRGGPWLGVIAIDKSKNMPWQDEGQIASKFAEGFIDYYSKGEKLGIVSFSFMQLPFISLDIHSVITGLDAKKAINVGYATGNTNIECGLRASLDKILNSGVQSDTKFIILVSSGKHKFYYGDLEDVISDLQENHVRVFTVGVGTDANTELLQDIADETGGRYYSATSEEEYVLDEIRRNIWSEMREQFCIYKITNQDIHFEQTTEDVFIDTFNNSAKFMIEYQGGDLDLTLKRPDETIIDPAVAETDPNIEYVEEDNNKFYRIYEPMDGEWQVIIDTEDVTGEESFTLEVTGLAIGVQFNVFTDKEQYTYPDESVLIQAEVTAMYNVANAEVTGNVERPDGSTVGITLYDDGLESHGDEFANDGFYSNYFSNYIGGGTYTFNMIVENTEGVEAYGGGIEIPPEGWEPEPISPFRRESSISILLLKAVTELTLDFPSTIQYSDMLSGKATLTTSSVPLENMEVEFNSILPTETLMTNASGEVYSTPYKIEEIPGTEDYIINANFYGNPYYSWSYVENYITIEKENATLTYIGDTSVEEGDNITLSCQVIQEDDGSPGDITYTNPVTFNVTGEEEFNEIYTASVDTDGIATTDITLPVGTYNVAVSIASDYFISTPLEGTIITVYEL